MNETEFMYLEITSFCKNSPAQFLSLDGFIPWVRKKQTEKKNSWNKKLYKNVPKLQISKLQNFDWFHIGTFKFSYNYYYHRKGLMGNLMAAEEPC